jgi:hypothetical protein
VVKNVSGSSGRNSPGQLNKQEPSKPGFDDWNYNWIPVADNEALILKVVNSARQLSAAQPQFPGLTALTMLVYNNWRVR